MSHVEQIKEKLTIVDVLGAYIKLEKSGANFKALCPFHHEKTPSFYVSPSRNSYYCFGCGMKGDIFSFVEEFEGVDFRGALKILAERAGVKLVAEDPKARSEKDRLFSALDLAASYFESRLKEPAHKNVLDYLLGRGLTLETIKEWRVGFAPMEWHAVNLFLKSKKFTDGEIEKVGLIKRAEGDTSSTPRFYDRFRGRIMFPINDSGGRVIGFSGRILVDDGKSAKYLNSPETELFNKSKILFGLDKAKSAIREKEELVLVEGQMDILLSHQVGVKNTVALSGTALTESHTELIHRFTNKIIFAFDPDNAGVKAARRSAILALKEGLEVKIALLPEGEDPADFIAKNKAGWEGILKNSMHIIHFSLEKILAEKADGKKLAAELSEHVFPFIFPLQSSIEKSYFLREIARKTGFSEETIIEDYKRAEKRFEEEAKGEAKAYSSEKPAEAKGVKTHRYLIERRIYGIILWQEILPNPSIDLKPVKERLERILGEANMKKVIESFSSRKDELVIEAEVLYDITNIPLDLEELFSHLEQDYLKEELAREIEKLSEAERSTNKGNVAEILKKCKDLGERLSKLLKR